MNNLFLTEMDQIVDLDYVAAIEIVDEPVKYSQLRYHLTTGVAILTRHDNRESAINEKWMAYGQMKPVSRDRNSAS